MKIGVLTGGGDVPGLNPCIKAVVDRAIDEGHEVVGVRRGWGGLLNLNPANPETYEECYTKLDKNRVRTIDRTGGTFLHTSRTNPAKVKPRDVPDFLHDPEGQKPNEKGTLDFTPHVLRNLEFLGIDRLIPIGGDDTLSFGERLHSEGFPVVAIPKTMDNDVYGTDYCIGFGTAVTRSVQFIHQLRTSTGSHERIAVVELFGRNSGETSLISSYLASVDRALISEVPFDVEKLASLVMKDKQGNPSNYAMVTISEGAHFLGGQVVEYGEADAYGHKKLGGIGQLTGEALKKLTGEDIIYQQVSYLMRSGAPDALDLMVGVNYANLAVSLIASGVSGRMVALRDGTYTHIPMSTVTSGLKRVDVSELYDVKEYRPKVRHVLGKPMFLY
ncbi:MAG: 6-phosphofructokinase [Caldilinea sp.]|uniref:6-phosphofructokinase n=1 Tax=Caldilinea sp. TaxID=2293560 RepID=UPI002BF58FDA|nr:6-phosphofructokinase [Anaerolineales bacterium]HQY90830.1 6-phosphofructokinase [Caldilinea sp.]